MVKLLISHGANVTAHSSNHGYTPLHYAALATNVAIIISITEANPETLGMLTAPPPSCELDLLFLESLV